MNPDSSGKSSISRPKGILCRCSWPSLAWPRIKHMKLLRVEAQLHGYILVSIPCYYSFSFITRGIDCSYFIHDLPLCCYHWMHRTIFGAEILKKYWKGIPILHLPFWETRRISKSYRKSCPIWTYVTEIFSIFKEFLAEKDGKRIVKKIGIPFQYFSNIFGPSIVLCIQCMSFFNMDSESLTSHVELLEKWSSLL